MRLDWRVPIFLTAALFGLFGSTGFGDANPPFATTNVASSVANAFAVPAVMKLDSSNRPVFLYFRDTPATSTGSLWVYRCNNADCTTGTNTEVVASGVSNQASLGLALDGNNFPVVAYPLASTIRVLRCSDVACTGPKSNHPVNGAPGATRSVLDIEVPGDLPAMVLDVSTTASYVRCLLPDCSTGATTNALPLTSGTYFQLEHTAGGLPVITMQASGMRIVLCNDTVCAAGGDTFFTLDSRSSAGYHSSLVLNGAGRAFVSYGHSPNSEVSLAVCNNAACNGTPTVRTIATGTSIGTGTSIALQTGNPSIAWRQATSGDHATRLARCADVTCTAFESTLVDGPYAGSSGGNTRPSFAFRNSTGYAIGVYNRNDSQVRLLRAGPSALDTALDDVDCTGTWTSTDALIIVRQLAGLTGAPQPVAPCTTDVDGVPGTTLGDAIHARRKAAGL